MARRRGTGAKSSSGLTFPPLGGPWGALQALMDDGGQVTMGAVGEIALQRLPACRRHAR